MASLSLCSLASRASSPNRFAASTTLHCASIAFNSASRSGIESDSLIHRSASVGSILPPLRPKGVVWYHFATNRARIVPRCHEGMPSAVLRASEGVAAEP